MSAIDSTPQFKKAFIERALGAEMTHHFGSAPGEDKPAGSFSHRNGSSGKTVLTDDGPPRIDVPRDRQGAFEPQLISKHERHFTGFDDKIIALYARGLTVREVSISHAAKRLFELILVFGHADETNGDSYGMAPC